MRFWFDNNFRRPLFLTSLPARDLSTLYTMKNMNTLASIAIVLAVSFTSGPKAFADAPETWMVIPDQEVVSIDSSKPGPVDAKVAKPLWGAPWIHIDGMLRGTPSSPEVQAAKKNHNGANPRLIFVTTPDEYLARFSIRFIGGKDENNKGLPLIDLGHHVSAITLGSEKGMHLTVNRHSQLVASDASFRLENGETYKFEIEVKGTETLIRVQNGPTLYAESKFLDGKKRTIGLAGAIQGTIEIDEFSIWSVKDAVQKDWAERRDKLSVMKPIQLKEPPAVKTKRKKRPSKK